MAAVLVTLRTRAEPHLRDLAQRVGPFAGWLAIHRRDLGSIACTILGLLLLAASGGLL